MAITIDSARGIFPQTLSADAVPATIARFKQLSAEDQLAWIWFAYLEMGKTVTIATRTFMIEVKYPIARI